MDFLNGLFPADPSYAGLLNVERIKNLQRQSMLRAGLGVLGATTGRDPQETGPALAQNLGPAVANFPQELSGAAESAARLQGHQQSQELREQRRAIIEANPKREDESEVEWLTRLYPQFVKIGDTEIVSRLTQLISSVQQRGDDLSYREGTLPVAQGGLGRPEILAFDRQGRPRGTGAAATERQGQTEVEQMRRFTRERQLAEDYTKRIAPMEEAYTMIRPTFESIPLARDGDGTAQIELLYTFVRAMDPASVVREGEVALARQAAPFWTRAKAWVREIEQNKSVVVPQEVVDQMASLLRRRMAGYERRWGDWYNQFRERAVRWNIEPDALYEPPTEFSAQGVGSKTKKPIGSY